LVKLMTMIIVIIYSDILQNAPFRSQIFKIFFASGDKGALTLLTKILRTMVAPICMCFCVCRLILCYVLSRLRHTSLKSSMLICTATLLRAEKWHITQLTLFLTYLLTTLSQQLELDCVGLQLLAK